MIKKIAYLAIPAVLFTLLAPIQSASALDVPSGLSATGNRNGDYSEGSVTVSWTPVTAADNGYAISFNTELTGVPVLDIYEDFQCPVCLEFESINMKYIDSLITEKKATVHYHVLSFLGDESVRAANASACAADESKFMQYHNGLYANQPKVENSGEWSNDRLVAIGAIAGISSDSFKNCVNNLEYEGWVTKSAEAGAKANINSTPTVLVNGKEINRQTDYMSAANFKAAVEG
jgi:protein-disulfide isomerase